ncbi:MAG: D-alanine--D-alanine ligase [Deltaproteobacteria bacterium]|nr:D-alanine--D-alanine ligase [Deltaproteobacteria bacterium]
MKRKLRVAILFGGKSAEHEISLLSAKSIFEAIDKEKYDILLIGISKGGEWILQEGPLVRWPKAITARSPGQRVALVAGKREAHLVTLAGARRMARVVDVVFPVLHGPFGEDGTMQGLLKLADVPFVGAGVTGSALGMDKDVMKRLLRDAGIRTAKFLTLHRSSEAQIGFVEAQRELGLPLFVKPANLGSSVGIAKVKNQSEFERAVRDAFRYDRKILVEECIQGRELECSVLGNDNPIASLPGEIIPQRDFYSYEAKYLDERGALLKIPAELPHEVVKEVQQTAVKTFETLCCEGMARVDFFLRDGLEVVVNEINTIPGFTKISMYPKMWEASGISFTELVDRLIELAIERFAREKRLKTSR